MLLELSEILACPACGPPQVMVAVVHEADGRDVVEGMLACPSCDGRRPIVSGVAWLGSSPHEAPGSESVSPTEALEETGVVVGALLGLERGGGLVLFGEGLCAVADAVARMAGRWNVVCVSADGPTDPAATAPNVSHVVSSSRERLPILSNRVWGAVVHGSATATDLVETARVIVPGGRLAILEPRDAAAAEVEEAGMEVRASDGRALLAIRPFRSQA